MERLSFQKPIYVANWWEGNAVNVLAHSDRKLTVWKMVAYIRIATQSWFIVLTEKFGIWHTSLEFYSITSHNWTKGVSIERLQETEVEKNFLKLWRGMRLGIQEQCCSKQQFSKWQSKTFQTDKYSNRANWMCRPYFLTVKVWCSMNLHLDSK